MTTPPLPLNWQKADICFLKTIMLMLKSISEDSVKFVYLVDKIQRRAQTKSNEEPRELNFPCKYADKVLSCCLTSICSVKLTCLAKW